MKRLSPLSLIATLLISSLAQAGEPTQDPTNAHLRDFYQTLFTRAQNNPSTGSAWSASIHNVCQRSPLNLDVASNEAAEAWRKSISLNANKTVEYGSKSCIEHVEKQDRLRALARRIEASPSRSDPVSMALEILSLDPAKEDYDFYNRVACTNFGLENSPSLRHQVVRKYVTTERGRASFSELCGFQFESPKQARKYVKKALIGNWNKRMPARGQIHPRANEISDQAAVVDHLLYNLLLDALSDKNFVISDLESSLQDRNFSSYNRVANQLRPQSCSDASPSLLCACLGKEFINKEASDIAKGRGQIVQSLLATTHSLLLELFSQSAFSDKAKESLKATQQKYQSNAPDKPYFDPFESPNNGYNASFDPSGTIRVNLGASLLGQDPRFEKAVHSLMVHEWGHFVKVFEGGKDSQIEWDPADQVIFERVGACIDENIRRGEYAMFALEGRIQEPPTEAQLIGKRSEYFADLFAKQFWKTQKNLDQESFLNELTLFCLPKRSNQDDPLAEVRDPHPYRKYRILTFLQGIIPLEGESQGIQPPLECEKIIWPE